MLEKSFILLQICLHTGCKFFKSMNELFSFLRFGSVAWIKGLTLLWKMTLLLWMTSLFWTVKKPTSHQVRPFWYMWIYEMWYCGGMPQKTFRVLCKNLRWSVWGNWSLKLSFRPQLCQPVAVLLKMVCVSGCRGLKIGWTGSATPVPLAPQTLGLQETTLLAKVTFTSCTIFTFSKILQCCKNSTIKQAFVTFAWHHRPYPYKQPQVTLTGKQHVTFSQQKGRRVTKNWLSYSISHRVIMEQGRC